MKQQSLVCLSRYQVKGTLSILVEQGSEVNICFGDMPLGEKAVNDEMHFP